MQNLENYGLKDHEPTRQEALQGRNRWGSERRVVRYEGNDDKGEVTRRSAIGSQDMVNSRKETAGAVQETQEIRAALRVKSPYEQR